MNQAGQLTTHVAAPSISVISRMKYQPSSASSASKVGTTGTGWGNVMQELMMLDREPNLIIDVSGDNSFK